MVFQRFQHNGELSPLRAGPRSPGPEWVHSPENFAGHPDWDAARERRWPGLRVLIVSHFAEESRQIAHALEGIGYEARYACDYKQAIGAACEWSPNLLLVELDLPGRNGMRLARALRIAFPALNAVAIVDEIHPPQSQAGTCPPPEFLAQVTHPLDLSTIVRVLGDVALSSVPRCLTEGLPFDGLPMPTDAAKHRG